MSKPTRPPYEGTKTSLIISIDLGTTYSGASYSILRPGEVPEVYDVIGYEGQEDRQANTKVPTVLYYDYNGGLVACGSENRDEVASHDEYIKVEWFKLLLRPAALAASLPGMPDITLPPNRTIVDVIADFLRYMNRCVREYICRTHVDGETLWTTTGERMKYILSHPNGWEGAQQGKMRRAAVMAGLVPDTNTGWERVEFVTEGEASFHWCMEMKLLDVSTLSVGNRIIIADAGGGTIDVSAFKVTSLRPLKLAETSVSDYLAQNTELDDEDYIHEGVKDFDNRIKCTFNDSTKPAFVKIGSRKVNHPQMNVRNGQLKLLGSTVAATFERSCGETAEAILQKLAGRAAHVFLVGGFAASPWLYAEVKRRLLGTGIELRRADSHTRSNSLLGSAKAVAHGAVSFYIDRLIASRIAKNTYGVAIRRHYQASNVIHVNRKAEMYTCGVTGKQFIDGGFEAITTKGTAVPEDATYRCALVSHRKNYERVTGTIPMDRYTGVLSKPEFYDLDAAGFTRICKIDYAIPASALKGVTGSNGKYWDAEFEVVLELGATELKCYTEWDEKGTTKKGPAVMVWVDDQA
ncbi:hypothetical protein FRB99_004081 [Tulasnella sp. 403]|nr:hypothetical protein FRB99_004081 [Tulasnella sp. 403]